MRERYVRPNSFRRFQRTSQPYTLHLDSGLDAERASMAIQAGLHPCGVRGDGGQHRELWTMGAPAPPGPQGLGGGRRLCMLVRVYEATRRKRRGLGASPLKTPCA